MPTLGALTTSVFRDLADDAQAVFTQAQVEDFIKTGINEVNRVGPLDTYVVVVPVAGTTTYSVNIVTPTRVVILDYRYNEKGTIPLAALDGSPIGEMSGRWGWNFRRAGDKGSLDLPRSLVDQIAGQDDTVQDVIRLYGYAYRPIPASSGVETGLSYDEETAVREWAKSEGFLLLTHDRSLFAQWQGQTNNTDVSPVMMMNMAAQAKQEWSRRRGLIRVIRKQD